MDGSQSSLLVSDLQRPVGLTVDTDNSDLYWCDTSTGHIEKYNYRVYQRKLLFSVDRPVGLTLGRFGGDLSLYWISADQEQNDKLNHFQLLFFNLVN